MDDVLIDLRLDQYGKAIGYKFWIYFRYGLEGHAYDVLVSINKSI